MAVTGLRIMGRASRAGTGNFVIKWENIDDIPANFPPSPHTHPQEDIINLVEDLAGKEPVIFPSDTTMYWRGDKTWQTLPPPGQADWNDITNKPTTFPPTLPIPQSGITGLTTDLDGKVDVTGDTMTGPLRLPAGSATVTSLNFGAAGTGIYGAAMTLNFAVNGFFNLGLTPTLANFQTAISLPNTGTSSSTILNFGTPGTGIYSSGSTSINMAIGGVVRMLLSSVALTTSVPVVLPVDPINPFEAATKQYVDSKAQTAGGGSRVSGVIIPFYIIPNDPYTDPVCQGLFDLIHKYHDIPTIVIANPANGPGVAYDTNWGNFIKLARSAGAKVLGYVKTGYALRPEADVKTDINLWMSLYGANKPDGIFLDEQTWDTGPGNVGSTYVDLYKRYTDFCHAAMLYPVVANPGTNQQPAYFATWTADVILVHENSTWPSEASMEGNYPGGHADYSYTRRGGLVYNQPTLNTTELLTLCKNVQWVYVTSDNLPNPWDTLPSYLEALFEALPPSGGSVVFVGDNPPSSPSPGQEWWKSSTGEMFLYYKDADSSQWVQTNAPSTGTWVIPTADTKNRIVNGAFQISQENGTTSGTASGFYFADQWQIMGNSTGVITASQNLSPTAIYPSRAYLRCTTAQASITGTQYWEALQRIEGTRFADFHWSTPSPRAAVIKLIVYTNTPGTYSVAIRNFPLTHSFIGSFTISASEVSTTVEKTIVVPPPPASTWATDNSMGMDIAVVLACGPTIQGVAGWQAGNFIALPGQVNFLSSATNIFYLFGVGLYLDTKATGIAPPWQLPDEASELLACQRYYLKTNIVSMIGGGGTAMAGGVCSLYSGVQFPVSMRPNPAVAFNNVLNSNTAGPAVNIASSDGLTVSSVSSAGGLWYSRFGVTANARM